MKLVTHTSNEVAKVFFVDGGATAVSLHVGALHGCLALAKPLAEPAAA